MVSWLEVFLIILFVVSIADAATRRSKSSPNFAGRRAERRFHEWQGRDGPQYGNVATLEAAKQAFRAAWDRRPKASGNG
jgi:hypothetical protein